jgi:hypothetical protein
MDAKFCIHGNLVALPNGICPLCMGEPDNDEGTVTYMLGNVSCTSATVVGKQPKVRTTLLLVT